MQDPGGELNTRVWRLFSRAGFETRPNEQNSAEEAIVLSPGQTRPVDLVAAVEGLGVTIVGQNTISRNLGISKTAYIHDVQELITARNAQAGLIVWTNIEASAEEIQYAKDRRITIWGKDELNYYETVADTVGDYAKYEIIHSLGIRTNEEAQTYKTLALRLNQPKTTGQFAVYQFTINPHNLLRTAVVYRRAQGNAEAYQRMLQKSRLPKIRRFVSAADSILPTNIIVHLGDTVIFDPLQNQEARDTQGRLIRLTRPTDCEIGILSIPLEYASLELIDGQHRLFGFSRAENDVRMNFNLVITGLVELPKDKRRDLFVSINDNSRRMDANLVAYLKYTEDEDECQRDADLMAIRIAVALNKDSALQGQIKLLDMGKYPISLKGLSGYDLRSLVLPRGLLRRYYGNTSEAYIRVLRTYFSVIKSVFDKQWRDPITYITCTNTGISAFLKLLKTMLKTADRALEAQDFRYYLQILKEEWSGDWKKDALRGRYVGGSAGWKGFHTDMVNSIKQRVNTFGE